MADAEVRLEAIQSMLAAGHRSLHLERHTLLLWGGVGGVLCAATDRFINAEIFPDLHQHALALLLWLSVWLGATAWLDQRLTRKVRRAREETLPFAQAQLTRAWWMLLTMGTLGSCAMFFYGGGAMIYALWTVLLGLGIYLFGLFSRPLTEWIGLATILLGVAGLATGMPFETTRWIAAACFAIGMPLTGWMAARQMGNRLVGRSLALMAWIFVVVTPPLWLSRQPDGSAVPAASEAVLSLPAGTVVPFKVDLESDLLAISPDATLPVTLRTPIDVAVPNGAPDGRYRLGSEEWSKLGQGLLRLRIDRISPRLEGGQPVVRAHAVFKQVGGTR